ncbi:MAG: TIGR00282 family metallophosphoesterase [bacterium]
MTILFIGDVFGKPGRRVLAERLPALRRKRSVELVVANGENAAEGFGLTPAIVEELCAAGVDVITTGDHVWDKREITATVAADLRLLRPSNYPEGAPGRGAVVAVGASGLKIGVLCLQGRVFMFKQILDEPFRHAAREVARLKQETPVVVVDFHAEATSEKVAMGWHLDGAASAVLGTHTHVQTADGRVLPGGTAYLTDVGMTGPADGVIGFDRQRSLHRFLTQTAPSWQVAAGPVQLCGALVEVDEKTGRAASLERVFEIYPAEPPAQP